MKYVTQYDWRYVPYMVGVCNFGTARYANTMIPFTKRIYVYLQLWILHAISVHQQ